MTAVALLFLTIPALATTKVPTALDDYTVQCRVASFEGGRGRFGVSVAGPVGRREALVTQAGDQRPRRASKVRTEGIVFSEAIAGEGFVETVTVDDPIYPTTIWLRVRGRLKDDLVTASYGRRDPRLEFSQGLHGICSVQSVSPGASK